MPLAEEASAFIVEASSPAEQEAAVESSTTAARPCPSASATASDAFGSGCYIHLSSDHCFHTAGCCMASSAC